MAVTVVNNSRAPLKSVASLNSLPEALITELRQWWVNQGPPPRAQEILDAWGYQMSHTKLLRQCENAWPELQVEDVDCLEDPDASHEENTRRLLARKGLIIARQINVDRKDVAEVIKTAAQALKEVTAAALQIERAEAERVRTEEYKQQLKAEIWEEVHGQMTAQLKADIHEPPDLFKLMEYGTIAAYLAEQLKTPTEQEQPMQAEARENLQ